MKTVVEGRVRCNLDEPMAMVRLYYDGEKYMSGDALLVSGGVTNSYQFNGKRVRVTIESIGDEEAKVL